VDGTDLESYLMVGFDVRGVETSVAIRVTYLLTY